MSEFYHGLPQKIMHTCVTNPALSVACELVSQASLLHSTALIAFSIGTRKSGLGT